MTDIFELADALGPPKTIHIHEPSIGLQGILVIDNVAFAFALEAEAARATIPHVYR